MKLGVRWGGTVGSVRGRLDGCTLLGLGTDAADISLAVAVGGQCTLLGLSEADAP